MSHGWMYSPNDTVTPKLCGHSSGWQKVGSGNIEQSVTVLYTCVHIIHCAHVHTENHVMQSAVTLAHIYFCCRHKLSRLPLWALDITCITPQGRSSERPNQPRSMSFSALILKPLAYFGLPAYLIHRLSQTSPRIRYYIRNILYICSVGFCSTLGFCSALPLYLLGRRYDVNYIVARSFYVLFGRLSGLKVVVEGEEHLKMRPCVMVGNHQSMLDLLYLGRYVASPILPVRCSNRWIACSQGDPG